MWSRWVLVGVVVGVAGCGMNELSFRGELDGEVRVLCETCGGQDCAAPPRDTDDVVNESELCRYRPAAARRCLEAVTALTADDCTDPAGAPGVFAMPPECSDVFACDDAR